jgi:epoxyqueuosine reductase
VDNYDNLKDIAIELGADLFGVTSTDKLREYIVPEIQRIAESLPFTVSIAVRLQREVLDTLEDGPNVFYKSHYKQANNILDRITFGMGQYIQSIGYRGLAIPASVIADSDSQRGHLSHRHAANLAGLGFLGRHGLVVHPDYGAAIRLASVLTNMPLHLDEPLNFDCGNCVACLSACPVDAISVNGVEDFNGQACYDLLKQFEKRRGIGIMICGLCVKACKGVKRG